MKFVSLLLVALFLCGAASAQASFKVNVTGMKDRQGDLCLLVFDKAEGFPSDHSQARHRLVKPCSSAANGVITFTVPERTLKNCAFVVLHDRDSNKRLNKNFLGIPTEGVGISNGVTMRPKFSRAMVKDPGQSINLRVRYL